MPEYQSQFGRKFGRGIRPWLLLPKVLSVALAFGGLAAVLVILTTPGRPIELAARLMRWLVIPAITLALLLGLALLLQHPRPFIRLRWLQVKAILLILFIPAAHFYLASRLHLLRQAPDAPQAHRLATHFTLGIAISLLLTACIILLSRHKPRLGQNWARDYAASSPKAGKS